MSEKATLEWFVDKKFIFPIDFDTTPIEVLKKKHGEGNQLERAIVRTYEENKTFSEFIVASTRQPLEEIPLTKDGFLFFLIRTRDWTIFPPSKGSRDTWKQLFTTGDNVSLESLFFCNGKSLVETFKEQQQLDSKTSKSTNSLKTEEALYNFLCNIFPSSLARIYSVRLFDSGIDLNSLLDTPISKLTFLKVSAEHQAAIFQAIGKKLRESRGSFFTNELELGLPRKRVKKEAVIEVDLNNSELESGSEGSTDSKKDSQNEVQEEKSEKLEDMNINNELPNITVLQNQSESEDTIGENSESETKSEDKKKSKWIGKRVKVFWQSEIAWFKGVVLAFNENGKPVIQYDDGDIFSEFEEDLIPLKESVPEKNNKKVKKSKKPKRFSETALQILKNHWKKMKANPYPTKEQKEKISIESGLSIHQIDVWFKNARVRGVPK